MIKHNYIFIVFTLVVLTITACTKESSTTNFVNLDSEFVVNINQKLTEEGPLSVLEFSTTEAQECGDSKIVYQLYNEEGNTNIIIDGISIVEFCQEDEKVISESILLKQGTTTLSISLRDIVKNTGHHIATPEQFRFEMNSTNGLIIERNQINRIPLQTVFGYIGGTSSDIDNAITILNTHTQGDLTDGSYGLFTKREEDFALDNYSIATNETSVYFLINNPTDFDNALLSIRETFPSLEFELVNAYGKKL